MAKLKFSIIKHKQEGNLSHTYSALQNLRETTGKIVDFTTDKLGMNLKHPINIECQPSYDGTVNLILNDDFNPPRIINSRFTKLEDNKFKVINRNQLQQTNLYDENLVDIQTRLFRNLNCLPKIDLESVSNSGNLMGGTYTFYLKFADNDYNQTDIVGESGQVSVFKGDLIKISSISGVLANERTDKSITLKISNIDASFSKIYIYYTRDSSDTNGIRITSANKIVIPYDITSTTERITITGYESVEEISPEEINIQYNIVTSVKTQAQVQNMLFFGNVEQANIKYKELQNISYYISVSLNQGDNIGYVNPKNYIPTKATTISTEYYSPYNIYYKLGYWPDEIYRLGIVYIMNDDSLTPVFNLRGCEFTDINQSNINSNSKYKNLMDSNNMVYVPKEDFIPGEKSNFVNTLGVFKTPKVPIIKTNSVNPLSFNININSELQEQLLKLNIRGCFIVRQKRIPTTIAQGYAIGVEGCSHIPVLPYKDGSEIKYIAERFVTDTGTLVHSFDLNKKLVTKTQGSGLLCLDSNIMTTLQSNFDGSDFVLNKVADYPNNSSIISCEEEIDIRRFNAHQNWLNSWNETINAPVVFVNSESPLITIDDYKFSTKAGVAEDVSQFSFLEKLDLTNKRPNIVRGIYCPFLGVGASLDPGATYDIKIPNYSDTLKEEYFLIRGKNNDSFFSISDRVEFTGSPVTLSVYRGDCFTNTVTIRINRNFIDSEVPINEHIIDSETWISNFKGLSQTMKNGEDSEENSWNNINRADVNTVELGMWITYKCLSNYNLGLRSEDRSNTDEMALMGNPRTFYPISDTTTDASHKIEESWLLNDGYDSTVNYKRNYIAPDIPYVKDIYHNRIMFSNVQRNDDFKNAYRIFQGLSYADIDSQYGAIVKFIPWNGNIFCVFEHGIGIIPINEKALIQTTTGQSIHMYGAGVLQNQITLISPDYGSIWQESIIRTPLGIYGVDTYAKKVWRYSENKGFEIISDMKIQSFLNSGIKLNETDKYPIIGFKNVKTHYNNYKGDVMFTFYNNYEESWNLCFNERMDKWVTRYSWMPLYSENIDNIFYSLDQRKARIGAIIYDNLNCSYGVRNTYPYISLESQSFYNKDSGNNILNTVETCQLSLVGGIGTGVVKISSIVKIESAYTDGSEQLFEITNPNVIDQVFEVVNGNLKLKPISNISVADNFLTKTEKTFLTRIKNKELAYFILYIKGGEEVLDSLINTSNPISCVISFLVDDCEDDKLESQRHQKDIYTQNSFYLHGKAGIFNEIDYLDDPHTEYGLNNQILPTKWYNKQEPFEFEFVVNESIGLHKIFDNLVIISNNVQPNTIEYEITGDVYNFNKVGIYWDREWDPVYNPVKYENRNNPLLKNPNGQGTFQTSQTLHNCEVKWDPVLNTYSLVSVQPCYDLHKYGRRLGNIQYKEDAWYITIAPITYKEKYKAENSTSTIGPQKEVRIRDKYVKIRVKYTGEDIVIITALKTILTQSYA